MDFAALAALGSSKRKLELQVVGCVHSTLWVTRRLLVLNAVSVYICTNTTCLSFKTEILTKLL